jgi:hypothetical protein
MKRLMTTNYRSGALPKSGSCSSWTRERGPMGLKKQIHGAHGRSKNKKL